MSDTVLLHQILESLNSAAKADPQAMTDLIGHRVPCNETMADHPTVQVGPDGDGFQVGMLGVLNGLIEDLTGHRVAAVIDTESGNFVGFQQYKPEPTA